MPIGGLSLRLRGRGTAGWISTGLERGCYRPEIQLSGGPAAKCAMRLLATSRPPVRGGISLSSKGRGTSECLEWVERGRRAPSLGFAVHTCPQRNLTRRAVACTPSTRCTADGSFLSIEVHNTRLAPYKQHATLPKLRLEPSGILGYGHLCQISSCKQQILSVSLESREYSVQPMNADSVADTEVEQH